MLLEDFDKYFFLVTNDLKGKSLHISVQANHIDGRKFSYVKEFLLTKIQNVGIDGAKALVMAELLENLNKEEDSNV